jgi:hypothetical protein
MAALLRVTAVISLGSALAGCATEDAVPALPENDAGAGAPDGAPPREENPIKLTLWPFWDLPVRADGFGAPEPLAGVTVCVAKKRSHEQDWEQFVDTTLPCARDVPAGDPVVLNGVPAMSELVLTAEKDGYLPRALPVKTGQWDEDMRTGDADISQMHLFTEESAQYAFPGSDLGKGQIVFLVTSIGVAVPDASTVPNFTLSFLGGVSVALEPPAGEGPFYFSGGVIVDGASSTFAGDLQRLSGAVFTSLPRNEYLVRLSDNAILNPTPVSTHQIYGFPDRLPGVIRAPVLEGYFTEVVTGAFCKAYTDQTQSSCAGAAAEAGAP